MPKSTSDCCATGCKRLWPKVRLGDVCNTINGLWKGVKPPFITVGVIRSTNFSKNCEFSITPKNTVYIEVEEKKYLKRKLLPGDLIVERSGGSPGQPVGRVVLFDRKNGEFTISNFTSILRIKQGTNIDPMYLQRCLTSFYVRGETDKIQSHTIALHNLDFDAFLDFKIPLPPLAEQKKIVEKVEKALKRVDALKAQFERMEKSAADYFKAALAETFAAVKGEKVSLENLCELIVDCPHTTAPDEGVGYPLVRTPNIGFGRLVYENMHRVSKMVYDARNARAVPRANDLVFAREAPAGNIAVLQDGEEVCLGQRTVLLRPKMDIVRPDFLAVVVLSPASQKKLLGKSFGATVQHVNVKDIRRFEVIVPALKCQDDVVRRVFAAKAKSERMAAAARRCIGICGKMRKAILAEAFQ